MLGHGVHKDLHVTYGPVQVQSSWLKWVPGYTANTFDRNTLNEYHIKMPAIGMPDKIWLHVDSRGNGWQLEGIRVDLGVRSEIFVFNDWIVPGLTGYVIKEIKALPPGQLPPPGEQPAWMVKHRTFQDVAKTVGKARLLQAAKLLAPREKKTLRTHVGQMNMARRLMGGKGRPFEASSGKIAAEEVAAGKSSDQPSSKPLAAPAITAWLGPRKIPAPEKPSLKKTVRAMNKVRRFYPWMGARSSGKVAAEETAQSSVQSSATSAILAWLGPSKTPKDETIVKAWLEERPDGTRRSVLIKSHGTLLEPDGSSSADSDADVHDDAAPAGMGNTADEVVSLDAATMHGSASCVEGSAWLPGTVQEPTQSMTDTDSHRQTAAIEVLHDPVVSLCQLL